MTSALLGVLRVVVTGFLCHCGAGCHNIGPIDIWGWLILCGRGCPGHCVMVGSIPGLWPLKASGVTSSSFNDKCVQMLPDVLRGQYHPGLRMNVGER